jgi:hypothetical protein
MHSRIVIFPFLAALALGSRSPGDRGNANLESSPFRISSDLNENARLHRAIPASKGQVVHVNAAGPYTTIASAKAACPDAPAGCRIIVDDGSTLVTPSFSLGEAPCSKVAHNGFAQVLELGVNVQIFLTGSVHLLCSGYIHGQNRDGSILEACTATDIPVVGCKPFPSDSPIVDLGNNHHLINARVEDVTINCNLAPGCIGVRGRGLNENSYIGRNLIENYLRNGIQIDGTTINTANFTIEDNQLAAWSGASDGIYLNNAGAFLLQRNTIVSNDGKEIPAAAVHVLGTAQTSSAPSVINSLHCERYNDCIEQDGLGSLVATSVSAQDHVINTYHIASSAVGSAFGLQLENNGNSECTSASCIVRNDATGRQISSANPPASNGVVPFYLWQGAGGTESWVDIHGWHFGSQINQTRPGDIAGVVTCSAHFARITFAKSFSKMPVIILSDETKMGGAMVSSKSRISFDVTCAGASDVFDWMAIGNPE